MAELRGIYQRGKSKIYTTSIKRFNFDSGKWEWHYVSTHTTDPIVALKTREELQALEYEIAKHGNSNLSREKAFETVNALLRWHSIPEISDPSPQTVSIKDFSEPWLKDLEQTRSLATYRHYKTHVENFRDFIGETSSLRSITKRQVQDWYNALKKSGLKPKTLLAYLKSVRRLFVDAIDEGVLTRSPAAKIKTVSGATRKKEPFSAGDLSLIFQELESLKHPAEWHLVCLFGLCLGLRLNDCTIRKWDEVELEGAMTHINYIPGKTAAHGITVKAPLVDPLLSALKSTKQDSSGFITPTLAKLPSSGRGSLSTVFGDAMRESGVEYRFEEGEGDKGIGWASKGFHSFRHTLPSLMAAANVPEQIRMGIVGHTKLETHLGYTHHDDEQMRGALESSLKSIAESFG